VELMFHTGLTDATELKGYTISRDRPKTDYLVLSENKYSARNATEYSADNEYSAKGSKHCKNVNLDKENKIVFLVAAASCS
jgi:hypothetical protein